VCVCVCVCGSTRSMTETSDISSDGVHVIVYERSVVNSKEQTFLDQPSKLFAYAARVRHASTPVGSSTLYSSH